MAGHNLPSFINNVLLDEMRRMLSANTLYLLTGQVACGIEFLGACRDAFGFHVPGKSKQRFRAGVDLYMRRVDARYALFNSNGHQFDLYYHLRCGMAHVIRPAGNIAFIDRGNGLAATLAHLTVSAKHNKLILFPEVLFDDFAKACDLLINDLPTLTDAKLYGDFLPVSSA